MAVKKKKGKDDSSEKRRPNEEGTSARPPPPKRKFQHAPCVTLQTGLNTANQNHLNELRRFKFKYFVQWPRDFLTSTIFLYYKTFRTLFFFETSLKKKKRNTETSL